ncbi:Mitochondrial hydroxyacyl-coenzyme a dehydrogenase [Fasciola gigantica]|uniref:3-hydroxyacyl-CoA dehydrogenase n=1 Tax=Fasciola gigantica TaxID=46835 RepID=A0A504Z145_FASGI|nr:Mitochondrial hydroxyacyl-coenzyme a dehydrogenase [Fasciola gigantica]
MAHVRLARCIANQCSRGLKTITVIGGGLMGSGIVQVTLLSGYLVHLVDSNEHAITKSLSVIDRNLRRIGKKKFAQDEGDAENFVDSCLANLVATSDLRTAVSQADLVIEAIVEKLDVKRDLFRQLEQCAPSGCCFASNTSSLLLGEIASALNRRERFGGLHFFNPVPMLKLVEVIRTTETSDHTFQIFVQFVRSIDKFPIICRDTPGFIVNRLLVPYLIEAINLVERGDASAMDVDIGMKLGAGYPMGPFELADFVGLDTIKHICDSFAVQLCGQTRVRCPAMLAQLVADGKLGRKSGEGFFRYDEEGNRTN